ncbi:MAG: sigma-54 dependent transcriptional regulator [Spirochaetia bacterium]|jgi:DNA-binding NtrC family response regulator
MVKVLFIDDDPQAQKTLELVLPEHYSLVSAYTARQGIDAAARERPDVILLDVNLPDMDGIAALRQIVSRPLPAPVVMLTALSAPRVVKEAILAGACDYIVKPYDLKELLGTLRTAVGGADARRAARTGTEPLMEALIGESAGMLEVKHLILRYAPSDSPVLILGESGTGKEKAARLIHEASRRRGGPFVALNCAALAETLLETELFGAERGAFTDAVSRPGSFEQANGGTLFLDEIGEMSPTAQTRLLRVIEQKELTRVGGTHAVPLDVRVVSATNRDLKSDASAGSFRPDLFYRLGVLPIRIPSLRERPEDIPILAVHFLALLARTPTGISPEAREKLCAYSWPGNIRELRNVMERAALAAEDGTIRARDVAFD